MNKFQSTARVYRIVQNLMEIPMTASNKFNKWRVPPFKAKEIFDVQITGAILMVCIGRKKLSEYIIDEDVVSFIKGMHTNTHI